MPSSTSSHETPEEMKRRQKETMDAKQMKAADAVASAELTRLDGEAIVRAKAHMEAAWARMCQGFGTDPQGIKDINKQETKRGLVNLAFLAVICGCELDLYGFAMAVPGYWDLDQLFVKIMCILGPVGYLLAAAMYMWYASAILEREERREQNESARAKEQPVALTYLDLDVSAAPQPPQPLQAGPETPRNSKQPITMQYYHFLPVCRFYLVVKDREVDDIEGLFRVNSLSSFSLGIAQICGIIFTGLETNWKLDLFTYINIGSQVINWSITFLYFMTTVSSRMGAAMKVEALIYNSDLRLRKKHEQYNQLVKEQGDIGSTETCSRIRQFETSIDREIMTLAQVQYIDLTPFTVEQKFEALKFLHRRMNNQYANI